MVVAYILRERDASYAHSQKYDYKEAKKGILSWILKNKEAKTLNIKTLTLVDGTPKLLQALRWLGNTSTPFCKDLHLGHVRACCKELSEDFKFWLGSGFVDGNPWPLECPKKNV